VAVQLAHDASGEDSELKGVGGVGPGGTQGPSLAAMSDLHAK